MVREPIAEIAALFDVYQSGLVFHCLCAVTRLGVPDQLGEEPRPVTEVAAAVGADTDALRRVLRLLAGHQLVDFDPGTDAVTLTQRGVLLRGDHPLSLAATFATLGVSDVAHRTADALRTGRAAAPVALGEDFWSFLAARPQRQAVFSQAMAEQARLLSLPCVDLVDWPTEGVVVDLGGGTGALLAAVLNTAPQLRGLLVDQPQVLDRSRAAVAERGLADRCEVRAGDLFGPAPAGDVYVLSRVLHDWDDEAVVRILTAAATNAPADARLVIFEDVLPEDGSATAAQAWADIAMMLLYEGARERTAEQYRILLDRGGWQLRETVPGPPGMHVIDATRRLA
ncbi:methyltransferase [Micromonospora sp. NPDC005215]|uniref:methyltransferase n=1 Tax=Micromonospora sp. NPDC005215 TaxID=3157024 RepID=UPI0033BDD92D